MLRMKSSEFLAKGGVFARRVSVAVALAVASSGVAADTLAQPASKSLEKAAAHYVRYREDVAAIEAMKLTSPEATRESHKRLAAHDPDELTAGWVAYAALVAADSPAFAASLQKELRRRKGSLRGSDAFLARLAEDPSYARKIKGAREAMSRVLEMTSKDVARFNALGEEFKEQAYAMQRTNWGKKRIASSSKRLDEAKTFAKKRKDASAPGFSRKESKGVVAPVLASAQGAWAYDWGAQTQPGSLGEGNAQVIMDRVMNLAARYAVSSVNSKVVEVYARNDKSNRCLSMSKLTLTQCIAATRTPYEEAFCLGEHGLNDVGRCLGWVAGKGSS